MTLDGYVAGPNGELDWMNMNWGNDIMNYVNALTDSVGTILLGRGMTEGFMSYWTKAASDPKNPEYPFARKMVDKPKVVFSKTLKESKWDNTVIAGGELKEEIAKLKNQDGKDIIVYGGAGFVSSLIKEGLIDEYHLFVNPAVIGMGLTIFGNVNSKRNLKLVKSVPLDCGIVLLHYEPKSSN